MYLVRTLVHKYALMVQVVINLQSSTMRFHYVSVVSFVYVCLQYIPVSVLG